MNTLPSSYRGAAAAVLALFLGGCGGGGGNGMAFPRLPDAETPPPVVAASVEIAGAVDLPARYTAAELASRSDVATQTVQYLSDRGEQTHTYTGANLWSLLKDAKPQSDPERKNDLNSRYVLATAADGYRSIFSLGELNPDLGNRASLLAYATTLDGQSQPLPEADGPFRLTAPGDIKGGRYVSNLLRLEVRTNAATAVGSGDAQQPASFQVSGAVMSPASFDIDALRGLPAANVSIGADEYTGVSLWALLDHLKLRTPESVKNPTLSMYAVATGNDNYRALLSLAEVDPDFGNNGALVAYELNGVPLDKNGMARLIVPSDLRLSRSVSNLVAIEVVADEAP